jgi:hypothetical protein
VNMVAYTRQHDHVDENAPNKRIFNRELNTQLSRYPAPPNPTNPLRNPFPLPHRQDYFSYYSPFHGHFLVTVKLRQRSDGPTFFFPS